MPDLSKDTDGVSQYLLDQLDDARYEARLYGQRWMWVRLGGFVALTAAILAGVTGTADLGGMAIAFGWIAAIVTVATAVTAVAVADTGAPSPHPRIVLRNAERAVERARR